MNKRVYTLEFKEISSSDISRVGGKCSSLGEMIQAKINVPPGFAITTDAFYDFISNSKLKELIINELNTINIDNLDNLEKKASNIKSYFKKTIMPKEIEISIKNAYRKLGNNIPVAVRSSATAEDLPYASFAGQQDTFLWLCGSKNLLQKVYDCWASLFNARAIAYRVKNKIKHSDVFMSVGVQKMVNSKVSGVAMSINPLNGDKTRIFIESSWGLGESVVSGLVNPDNFVIEKVLQEILEKKISKKTSEIVPDKESKTVIQRRIKKNMQSIPSLTDSEVIEVALLAKKLEKHFKCAQDIEWTFDKHLPSGENLFALQSRPETVWSNKKTNNSKKYFPTGLESIVKTLKNPYKGEN